MVYMDLYSAFVMTRPKGTQIWITQSYFTSF